MSVLALITSHILVGGPWEFSRRGNHDSFKNRFSFMKNKKLITLVPLTPSQVYEDQVRLQKESEQKKKSEKESEQKKKVKKRVCKKKCEK